MKKSQLSSPGQLPLGIRHGKINLNVGNIRARSAVSTPSEFDEEAVVSERKRYSSIKNGTNTYRPTGGERYSASTRSKNIIRKGE